MPAGGHIFVSYTRADSAYVGRLVTALTRAGVNVFFDRDNPTGDRWERLLKEKIRTCRALLLVMSPAVAASERVPKERGYARQLRKPILPLLYEGGPILDLDDVQYEDVTDGAMPSPAFLERLRGLAPQRRVVRHLVGQVPELAI